MENIFARLRAVVGTWYLKSTALLGTGTCIKTYCGTRYW